MEEQNRNLKQLCRDISSNLFDSITLVECLEEMIDGERKPSTILTIIENNLKNAFSDIEICRKYISI